MGSLDLSRFIINEYTSNSYFDYPSFKSAIHTSIRALDIVLDENLPNHPLKKQRKASRDFRNIGLGVFGLATALFKMRIPYGSERSKDLIDSIFEFMFIESVFASNNLAREKGTFPKYNDSVFESRIIKNHFTENQIEELKIHGLRNCSLLSIAPAGSIGTMMMRSTSAEPEYAIKYNRKTHNLDDSYDIYCDEAQYYLDLTGESKLPDYFVCSKDVHWKDRVDMQAVIQRHIDTGISSTVNLPNDTTVEEVEQLYLYAWKKKIKGITIFRDGCKREGILTTGSISEDEVKEQLKHVPTNAIGKKRKLVTGCGSLHTLAFFDPSTGDLLETYLNKGSTGGCNNFMIGLSRMLSLAARAGASIDDIVDQLKSTGTCSSYAVRRATKKDTSLGSCCPMAIANALLDMHGEMQSEIKSGIVPESKPQEIIPDIIFESNAVCPECGSALAFEGGCSTCKNCGYSKCS